MVFKFIGSALYDLTWENSSLGSGAKLTEVDSYFANSR